MRALVSLSGGMDSATVLAKVVEERRIGEVAAVGFSYGSKHNQYENEAARQVANHYGVPFRLIRLDEVMAGFQSALLQTGGDVPDGHYESESMNQTVVPGRNIIFASILTGLAWSQGASEVWLGIHQGDHAIYPDCRPEFLHAMNHAILAGTDERVRLVAPFLHVDKTTIIAEGLRMGVPYRLTRTCYKDQPIACGRCGACQERLEAFRENGIEDPIEYESRVML